MQILLDENVPQKLRLLIEGHSVVTTAFRGWSGLKNGDLIDVAENAGIELLITADQEIQYQQNLISRKIGLLVLNTNNWIVIESHVTEIVAAIKTAAPGRCIRLELTAQG